MFIDRECQAALVTNKVALYEGGYINTFITLLYSLLIQELALMLIDRECQGEDQLESQLAGCCNGFIV